MSTRPLTPKGNNQNLYMVDMSPPRHATMVPSLAFQTLNKLAAPINSCGRKTQQPPLKHAEAGGARVRLASDAAHEANEGLMLIQPRPSGIQ